MFEPPTSKRVTYINTHVDIISNRNLSINNVTEIAIFLYLIQINYFHATDDDHVAHIEYFSL